MENFQPAVAPTKAAAAMPVPAAIPMCVIRDRSCRRIEGIRMGPSVSHSGFIMWALAKRGGREKCPLPTELRAPDLTSPARVGLAIIGGLLIVAGLGLFVWTN